MSNKYICIYKMVIWGRLYYLLRELQIKLTVTIEINSDGGREEYTSEKIKWSKENIECVRRILCLTDLGTSRGSAGFICRPMVHEFRC